MITISKKFGICQIVEFANCKSFFGKTVSLSFEAKVTNATKLSDIQAVVLAWNSTVDTVTSDVVAAWGAEGVLPTFATNWTIEHTPVDLGVTTTWVKYKIETIALDTAGTNNVAVLIWSNNVATNDTAGIFLDITNVQLEASTKATKYEYRQFGDELAKCHRYTRVQALYIPATTAQSEIINMRDVPTITGGGSGYTSTGTTADTIVHYQTTGAVATLTLVAEL